jgi:hypothetical protein
LWRCATNRHPPPGAGGRRRLQWALPFGTNGGHIAVHIVHIGFSPGISSLAERSLISIIVHHIKLYTVAKVHVETGIAEATTKITTLESRQNEFESKIAENQNQLTGYMSKLKEYDKLIAQTGQHMGKEAAGYRKAIQRIHTLEEEFESLKVLHRTF